MQNQQKFSKKLARFSHIEQRVQFKKTMSSLKYMVKKLHNYGLHKLRTTRHF